MSKSWFGRRCPKKFGFAGSKPGTTLMPTACSCCEKIATEVARRWLPAVVLKRTVAGVPPHVQNELLFRVGTDGPPVQCAFRSAIAAFCENLYSFVYHDTAFVPIS